MIKNELFEISIFLAKSFDKKVDISDIYNFESFQSGNGYDKQLFTFHWLKCQDFPLQIRIHIIRKSTLSTAYLFLKLCENCCSTSKPIRNQVRV